MRYTSFTYFLRVIFGVLVLLMVTYSNISLAQNCDQKLDQAEDLYAKGVLSEIDILVQSCLKEQRFKKEQKIRVLVLLIHTELVRDNLAEADRYTIQLFKEQPLYRPNLNDSPEFRYHMKRFRSSPILRVGITSGMNLAKKVNLSDFRTDNSNFKGENWNPKLSFNISADLYLILSENFELKTALEYYQQNLNYTQNLKYNNVGRTTSISGEPQSISFDFTQVQTEENLIGINIPLELYYSFNVLNNFSNITIETIKYRPLIFVGYNYQLFINNNFEKVRNIFDSDGAIQRSITDQKANLVGEDIRVNGYGSVTAGAGIRMITGNSVFQLTLGLQIGLNNLRNRRTDIINNPEFRNLIFNYGYIDNNFKINSYALKFSYFRSLYKPKKIYK